MRGGIIVGISCLLGLACSADSDEGELTASTGELNPCAATPAATGGDEAASASAVTPEASPYIRFIDCGTGFSTDEVHDADREIVHFDASLETMVSATSGNSVGGWTVAGVDLDWSRSGVAFRVRFGTEAGERRAYFTETGPGTICNLNVAGPEVLFISATRETPPNP